MYKDDLWYRHFSEDVEEHLPDFTEKQQRKYKIELLLHTAKRVRDFSDGCGTCRGFQHTLTRLEEEIQELPDSKAQRQYQVEQLRRMAEHFVREHRLAPPNYYTRKYATYGLVAGLLGGFVIGVLILGNFLYLPAGLMLGLAGGMMYGVAEDATVENEHRRI
jgi:hypothetical protein